MAEAPAGEPSDAGQRRASQGGAASGSHLQPPVSPLPEDSKRWPSLQDFCQSITRKASPRRRTDPLVSFCDLLCSPGSSVSARPRTRHSRRARAAGGAPGSGQGVGARGAGWRLCPLPPCSPRLRAGRAGWTWAAFSVPQFGALSLRTRCRPGWPPRRWPLRAPSAPRPRFTALTAGRRCPEARLEDKKATTWRNLCTMTVFKPLSREQTQPL